ncbi:hypothetical protein MBLNU230_g5598t1 [Neophaeotheca triangularis]
MPPSKSRPDPDSRSDASSVKERQALAAAHARKSKANNSAASSAAANASAPNNGGSNLKELALVATADGGVAGGAMSAGMHWDTASPELLNNYRVAHSLQAPAAFTSPLNQARLTIPGIGRQSPTMARRKDKRRISKDQLALAVRKNFNSAAVNEIDVVVDLVYKVRNQDKAFRMRSAPTGSGIAKK